jgi:mediator of RNA polymerase II transcription subunit 10
MPPLNSASSPPDALLTVLRPAVQSLYALETQLVYPPTSTSSSSPQPSHQVIQNTLGDILAQLRNLSTTSQQSQQMDFLIPPDVIEYVQDGRNPDIYVREFVELTMKNNQRLRGKFEAFANFRDVLAKEMASAVPEMAKDVAMVVPEMKFNGER